MNAPKYFIQTYGCQMNVHDSERMAGMLESMGYLPVQSEEDANFILLNTCSIREKADHKLFTKLGRLSELKNGSGELVIAVAGCIAQRAAKEILQRAPFVDLVLGPRAVPQLPRMIEDYFDSGEKQICTDLPKDFDQPRAFVRTSSVVGYVTVMEGCNKYCSYCIVPFTRGHEVSKPVDMVLQEVQDLADNGYKEIHLLGQNVNAYDYKPAGVDFAQLLHLVADVDGIERIRFITSHPNHLKEGIARAMAERDNICKAVHLPPQSGNTRILKEMRRRYTREEYLDTVHMLRDYMPDIALSGDFIVGFPGETDEEFEDTMSLLEEVRFASLFSFLFSPRPGTKAENFPDDVPYRVKQNRLHRLQELQSSIQLEIHKQLVGTEQKVLFDGKSAKYDGQITGRTEGFQVVNVEAPEGCIGRILPVKITYAGPHSLKAEFAAALTSAVQ